MYQIEANKRKKRQWERERERERERSFELESRVANLQTEQNVKSVIDLNGLFERYNC